jgi:hypothetical protein
VKIDIHARKTEQEWAEVIAKFYTAASDLWFRLIEWILLTALLKYLWDKTDAAVFAVLYGGSLMAMYGYLFAFFILRLEVSFVAVTNKARWWIHLIVNGVICVGGMTLANFAIYRVVGVIAQYDIN